MSSTSTDRPTEFQTATVPNPPNASFPLLPSSSSPQSAFSVSSTNSAGAGGRQTTKRYAPYSFTTTRSTTALPQNQQHKTGSLNRNSQKNLFASPSSSPTSNLTSVAVASSSSCTFGSVPQSIASQRLHTELRHLNQFPVSNCHSYPSSDCIFKWTVVIDGPKNTVYEGGTFFVELNFSSNYPFTPPEVLFLTRIYHCNISNQGKVCLETTTRSGWKPSMGVSTILQSLVSLLYTCNPHSPLVHSIAEQYLQHPDEFERTARIWTERYAQ